MAGSSSDEIAIFQAYINLINSERETLWARHNALLLANSLIIGALAISPATLWENRWAALTMLGGPSCQCRMDRDHAASMVSTPTPRRRCANLRVDIARSPAQSVRGCHL
jgi:hypothetical protein